MQINFGLMLGAALAAGTWPGVANAQTLGKPDQQEQWQSEANARDRPTQTPDKRVSILRRNPGGSKNPSYALVGLAEPEEPSGQYSL